MYRIFAVKEIFTNCAQINQINFRLKVIEIVGVSKGNDGRTCGIHPICGSSLNCGDQIKLRGTLHIDCFNLYVGVSSELMIYLLKQGTFAWQS